MNPSLEKRAVESVAAVRGDESGTSATAQCPLSGMKNFVGGDISLLRRIDESQNDLVATDVHELRTPLTSLGMVLHLCLEQVLGPLTEKQAQALHTAREDCTRLQTMVGGLLVFHALKVVASRCTSNPYLSPRWCRLLYRHPPNEVKGILLDAIHDTPGVRPTPTPDCILLYLPGNLRSRAANTVGCQRSPAH